MNRDEQNNLLDSVSGILIRCFFLSFALLLISFIFYLLGGEWVYRIHSKWFALSRHDYDSLFYYGMAFIKTCAILFFLFPYLSIRLVLQKNKKNT